MLNLNSSIDAYKLRLYLKDRAACSGDTLEYNTEQKDFFYVSKIEPLRANQLLFFTNRNTISSFLNNGFTDSLVVIDGECYYCRIEKYPTNRGIGIDYTFYPIINIVDFFKKQEKDTLELLATLHKFFFADSTILSIRKLKHQDTTFSFFDCFYISNIDYITWLLQDPYSRFSCATEPSRIQFFLFNREPTEDIQKIFNFIEYLISNKNKEMLSSFQNIVTVLHENKIPLSKIIPQLTSMIAESLTKNISSDFTDLFNILNSSNPYVYFFYAFTCFTNEDLIDFALIYFLTENSAATQ